MQYINGFRPRCDVNDAIAGFRKHSQLPDTWTNGTHRLPIRWKLALLDFPELETDLLASRGSEGADTFEAVANPYQRLETHYIGTDIGRRIKPIFRHRGLMG